jgi:hypothetical protein
MKLLLFTRALVSASSFRFDAANRPQADARTLRGERTARLRCVWSRGADGRLACRWLRDDVPAGDGAIPVEAIRRFPAPTPTPFHPPQRTPTATRVTDFRRSGNMPAPVGTSNGRPAPDRFPRESKGIDHVRHVRPA